MACECSHCLYAVVTCETQSIERSAEIPLAADAVMCFLGAVNADLNKGKSAEKTKSVRNFIVYHGAVGEQPECDLIFITQLHKRKKVLGKKRFTACEVYMTVKCILFTKM
jgi:hypothetical protein